MVLRSVFLIAAFMVVASFGSATVTSSALAFGSSPAPKPCVKYKWGTKKWKRCRRQNKLPTSVSEKTEQALTLGYALSQSGDYAQSLKVLRPAEASDDPRVLTYIGFSERKLGRVDVAMGYYSRALAIDPRNVATLSYMGEAYLQKNDLAAAQDKLAMIGTLCGQSCAAYQALDTAIHTFVSKS